MGQTATEAIPKKRRWRKLFVFPALFLVLVAAIPWLAGTPPVRRWLLHRANAALSPGRLEVTRFRFSWFRPTVMEGFGLRNAEDHPILATSRAVWDRNLFLILFDRPRYGTLRLDRANLDIERKADGSIDLAETLRPVLGGPEETDLTIRIEGGTFRLRGQGLAEPVRASRFDLGVHRAAFPDATEWTVSLANAGDESLKVSGSYDRRHGAEAVEKDLELLVEATNWPLAVGPDPIQARTALSGHLRGQVDGGFWSLSGDFAAKDPTISGAALKGDRIHLGPTRVSVDAKQSASGWEWKEASLTCGVGTIAAKNPAKFAGQLDVAAVLRQIPHAFNLQEDATLDRGSVEVVFERTTGDPSRWSVDGTLSNLAGRSGDRAIALRRPATLHATVEETSGRLKLASLSVGSSFLTAEARPMDGPGVKVVGTLDLARFREEFGALFDWKGFEPSGKGRFVASYFPSASDPRAEIALDFDAIRFGQADEAIVLGASRLSASRRGERWNFGLDVASSRGAGLSLGPVRIMAAASKDGTLSIEPISTTLNGGTLTLIPAVASGPAGTTLRLLDGSSLENAEVNEELSRRVLSFAAPILQGATRAKGHVSAHLDRAEFPLNAQVANGAVIEGEVVFRDLVFAPGPLASELLGLVGRADATLKLDQPIVLVIAGGKVHQDGLAIPVGGLTRIELEGSVGFDRSLDLRATLPLTPAMFPKGGLVGDVLTGSRLTLPIGGTLARPRIDKQALGGSMADLGKDLLGRGAAGLLLRLAKPREQPATPRPSPEERRARRKEMRTRRREN